MLQLNRVALFDPHRAQRASQRALVEQCLLRRAHRLELYSCTVFSVFLFSSRLSVFQRLSLLRSLLVELSLTRPSLVQLSELSREK